MPSRYLCDVLEDMRRAYESRNFSGLLGSIEQAQTMANRMEAALTDKRTIEDYDDEAHRLNRNLKQFRKEYDDLQTKIHGLQNDKEEAEKALKQVKHELRKAAKADV